MILNFLWHGASATASRKNDTPIRTNQ